MRWWRTVLDAVDPRELPVAAGLAGLLVADALYLDEGRFGVAAVGALALISLPVLWRWSAPLAALGGTVLGVSACLATLNPFDVVGLPVLVCAYSVGVTGDRRRSALTAGFVVLAALGSVLPYLDDGATLRDAALNGVAIALAVVTGDLVRTRRAFREARQAQEAEQERKQRAEAERLVAEERLRIAQEVHDVVAHSMVAINVQAGVAAHVIDDDPEKARAALRVIKDASGVALTDLRGTLGVLRDDGDQPPLRPTGDLAGLDDLAAPLRGAGIDVRIAVEGSRDRVPAAVGVAAFRIAQEATTNILRHAGARTASITVAVGDEAVDLTVEDDGAARASVGGPVVPGSGNGLRGMSERASTLGGRLDAGRQTDGSWRVHAVLPL